MPGRANEFIVIPDTFWQRTDTAAALRDRDMGRLFALLQQRTGASQTRIGMACGMPQGKISEIIRGNTEVKHLDKFEEIADGLHMPDPSRVALGLAPRAPLPQPASGEPSPAIPQGDTRPDLQSRNLSTLLSLDSEDKQQQEDDDPVRRRNFIGLAGAVVGAAFAGAASDVPSLKAEPFASVLATPSSSLDGTPGQAPDIGALAASVDRAWCQFHSGNYSGLTKTLPTLLARLQAACLALDGEAQRHAFALSADAHRVAAVLLLKLDDQGLSYLAADRSMHAAEASGDPITVGTSSSEIILTLMSGGHVPTALTAAKTHAERLDHAMPVHTPESLSAYGAVLLRGAEAAAQAGKRATAIDLLDEADETAQRLGFDGNLRRTAFGPTNAKLYRVNLAVTLGDAGSAVDTARKVDLDKVPLPERRATLLVDTSRAFLQWGKHEKAYIALRAAEVTAHEEVAGRPSVQRLVRDLLISAPPSIRRDVQDFAAQTGVSR